MQVKKFEAKTMKEALELVKKELGPEAVILAARDNRKSFGLVGEGSVEVTAAVSENTLQKKHFVESKMRVSDREKLNNTPARNQKKVIDRALDQFYNEKQRLAQARDQIKRPITQTNYIDIGDEEDFIDRAPVAPPTTKDRTLDPIRAAAKQAWSSGLMSSAAPVKSQTTEAVKPSPLNAGNQAEVAALQAEIKRLQALVEANAPKPASLASLHPGADYGLPFEMSLMFQRLTDVGIGRENAAEILQACVRDLGPMQYKKAAIVEAYVASYILQVTEIKSPAFSSRFHLFMGPSGSGKTSTLVKMASRLVIQERKKVAILTTDTFKVGSVDQLKIYSQILNVPLAIVRNRAEWEWALGQLSQYESVLVDYPGLQLGELEELQQFRSLLPPDEVHASRHLVLPITSKDADATEMERRYRSSQGKATAQCDLIFTNIDQSTQHGLIYNLQKRSGLPLHSFATGNRIPEDFELASKERVLDLIFKLSSVKSQAVSQEAF